MKRNVLPARTILPASCLLVSLLLPSSLRAQSGGTEETGKIVSVRADIIQIRPQFSTALTRIVVDNKTVIHTPRPLKLEDLKPGMRLVGFGDYLDDGGIKPSFLMVVEDPTGFFAQKMRGVKANGYGRSAQFGGVVKTANPLVVTDDDGKDITPTMAASVPVMQFARAKQDALLVGQSLDATGDRTADGLLHAKTVDVNSSEGSSGGTLFGDVVAVRGETIEIRPRFGTATAQVTLGRGAKIQRQTTLAPDRVRLGDMLTVQGKRTGGTAAAPSALVAFVLLPGTQTYPKSAQNNFFPGSADSNDTQQTCTGHVLSLEPFILRLANGSAVTVTVPGQTPIADLHTAKPSDIKAGDKVMVIGTEGKDGGLEATVLVIGASPIVGFG